MSRSPRPSLPASLEQTLDSLRAQMQCLERTHTLRSRSPVSTGCGPLDRRLPGNGFYPGQLIEWLSGRLGSGVETLALLAVREVLRQSATSPFPKPLVVIDRSNVFYPPAMLGWGIDLARLIVLRPRTFADELWTVDQTLRCPAVAAVLVELPRLSTRDFRRLQLAAEQGGVLGMLLRPAHVRNQPSWSDIQLLVLPRPGRFEPGQPPRRRWQVEILRCRGVGANKNMHLEMDETAGTLREIPPCIKKA